jgi:photosystem II stability/assembly factor-like uncharacterized protein
MRAIRRVAILVGLVCVPGLLALAVNGHGGRHVVASQPPAPATDSGGGDPDAQPVSPDSAASGERREHEGGAESALWNQFYKERAYPAKSIPAGAYLHAQRQAARMPSTTADGAMTAAAAPTAVVKWTAFGPRPIPSGSSIYNGVPPYSGRVTTIAHSPTNAAVAYLGGAEGGVWKTTDSGVTWTPIFTGPTQAIGAIAVDPSNAQTIWVGTGEANSNVDSYLGVGIFRSTNGGTNWAKVGGSTFNNCHISDIVVSPTNSNVVIVSVSNSGRYADQVTCLNGVWRTGDGGSTWSRRILNGDTYDLANEPGSGSVFYAGVRGSGVWRSTDGGVTWAKSSSGLPTSNVGRIALATTPANSRRVYAAIGNASTYNTLGTFTSRDEGATWTPVSTPSGQDSNYCNYGSSTSTNGQCNYDLTAVAYPGDDTTVYFGGIRVQRYNGNWNTIGYDGTTSNGIHVDIHTLSFDSSNRLWVGSDGGAYRMDSGSVGFTNLNQTLSLTQFTRGIAGAPASGFTGGTQDNGTLYYDTSNGWTEFETGDGGPTAFDRSTSTYWSEYVRALIRRNTTTGDSCVFGLTTDPQSTTQNCSTRVNDTSEFFAPFVQSPSTPQTLYVGGQAIWRSTSGGTNWSFISNAYTSQYVEAIGPSKSNSQVVYGGWSYGGSSNVRVTQDGGSTWADTAALPNRVITDLQVKTTVPGTAWVTLSGFNTTTPTTSGHVFVTQNYGQTWTDVSGNLPDAPVNAIEVDSRTSPSTLYVATDAGVFWSVDGGSSWAKAATGMPATIAMDIHLDTPSETLIVATHGRGAYKTPAPSARPVITSFSPASGPVGTVVTVTGKRLTYVQTGTVGGVAASVSVVSATQVRVAVPSGTSGGPITLTAPGGTATSTGSFTVT